MQGRLEGILDGVYARDDARLNEVLEDTRLLSRLVEDLRTLAHAERGTLALAKNRWTWACLHDTVASFGVDAAAKKVTIRVADHGESRPSTPIQCEFARC